MALEGGEGSASRPGRSLPQGKTRYPLYRRLGGPQGWCGEVRKISPPTGIRSPGRTARSSVPIPTELSRPITTHIKLLSIVPVTWRGYQSCSTWKGTGGIVLVNLIQLNIFVLVQFTLLGFKHSKSFAHSAFVWSASLNPHSADRGKLCEIWNPSDYVCKKDGNYKILSLLSHLFKIYFYLHENSPEAFLLTTIFL